MRYRELDPNGDSTFGSGSTRFLVNTPEAVAQAVLTRLRLMTGEWFLDTSEGTPYSTEILGKNTQPVYDLAIQDRILNTQGVDGITDYSSNFNTDDRTLSVSATITTVYGTTKLNATL